jgi:type II secretory pathway component PulC
MNIIELKERLFNLAQQRTAILFAAILLLASFGMLIWDFINILRPNSPNTAINNFQLQVALPLQNLPNYHLMGASPFSDNELPLANLGLTLQGIFLDSAQQSTVIISNSAGQVNNYHLGDQIAPGATIEKILPDRIIVEHNNQMERLILGIQPVDFSSTTSAPGLW